MERKRTFHKEEPRRFSICYSETKLEVHSDETKYMIMT
jgi:hypothetical protein